MGLVCFILYFRKKWTFQRLKKMYLKKRLSLGFIIFIFVCLLRLIYVQYLQLTESIPVAYPDRELPKPELVGAEDVTLVLRVPEHRLHIASDILNISGHVLVVTDSYMPRNATLTRKSAVKFVNIGLDLLHSLEPRDPLSHIETNFVLLAVDFPRPIKNDYASILINRAKKFPKDLFIVRFKSKTSLQCLTLKLHLKQWTIEYQMSSTANTCMAARGSFGIFGYASALKQIPDPWLQSFPEALFIQAAARGINIQLVEDVVLSRGKYWGSSDSRRKILERFNMYDKLQVKKVVRSGVVEWYGCTRNTTRCFGTIHNDTPDYLMQGRWTPPCCLRVLRETARHVFRSLEICKVRYWLEGGSLLGAMRNGDIIPWDYDIDIGVYEEDLEKVPWIRELKRLVDRGVKAPAVADKNGFVWETSLPGEGHHYRVQASRINRLHVDIFPFYPRKGVMTKDTWMAHKQDMEFPESFLKPLTKISFVGTTASAPNNIIDFLEMKFGVGCIENPQYPNPSLIAYPTARPSEFPEV